jgi:hypothetical protein
VITVQLELLNRYRNKGVDTLFTPFPYLQFRTQRIHEAQAIRRAICLAWLFWSLRFSWIRYVKDKFKP